MPVVDDNVLSVNIAGVHLSGSGTHNGDATYNGVDGSVFCFSVVNPSEFLSNDGNIHNGNVAGWRNSGVAVAGDGMQSDIFAGDTETERQQGAAHQWYLNSVAPQAAFGAGDATRDFDGDSNVGPNFDVVAHFKHSFCTTKWTKEEMQMVGDWGSNGTPGSEDYPLGGGVDDNHAHTDTADKRFADDLRVGVDIKNDKYTCVDSGCDNTAGMQLGGTGDIVRWPNAGAWAGFYSFVACANADSTADYNVANAYKYVFHVGGAAASDCEMTGTAITGSADPVVLQGCMIPRAVVVSLANDDFRVEDCVTANRRLTARWNVRQAGTNIRNCGPGTLPDGDGARCSWNWNFNSFTTAAGLQDEAEAFFERSSPRSFEPWQAGAEVGRFVQEGSPTDPISDVVITSVLKDAAGLPLAGTIALDIPSEYVTVGEALNDVTAGTHTFTLGCNGGGVNGARDTFPDCFQGEEIHYEWTCNTDNCASSTRLNPWASAVSATFV
jgi:hypothetical protein